MEREIECLEKHSNVSSSFKLQSKTCVTGFSSNSSCIKAAKYTLQHLKVTGHEKGEKPSKGTFYVIFSLIDESNCANVKQFIERRVLGILLHLKYLSASLFHLQANKQNKRQNSQGLHGQYNFVAKV